MTAFKAHFSRFFAAEPGRLHFAAHSHHPWLDATFAAHQQAWLDAAGRVDEKWDLVFGTVWPAAQRHVATELHLGDPRSVVFAPNTHELVLRLLSCLPERPRIVTSDAEFHSFERQVRRLEEDGLVTVARVAAEPAATFGQRLVEAAAQAPTHLVFFSHVFFNSGAVVPDLPGLVSGLPESALVVIDGYHGFCAVPTDLSALEARAFYLAGGYKYAMAGEGACFLHVPANAPRRPRNTGWFAAFGALDAAWAGAVAYAPHAMRFMGSTFDASGLYRFNAACDWRAAQGLSTESIRAAARGLQRRFLDGLTSTLVREADLVVPRADEARGQFLTFHTPKAGALAAQLKAMRVIVDAREDRLRFGFGVYQDEADVDALLQRVAALAG